MQIVLDGVDVTASLQAAPALEIVRELNRPSQCKFALLCGGAGPAAPQRGAFVQVNAQNGAVLFTGYIAADPFCEFSGAGATGATYTTLVSATSEEFVLDCQTLPAVQGGVNQGAGAMLGAITQRLESRGLNVSALTAGPAVGVYRPASGARWSEHAAELAAMSRQSYRALAGVVKMTPAGSVSHVIGAGETSLKALQCDSSRVLANDVTLTGAEEPDVYVTEIFQGDGATKEFVLSRSPMHLSGGTIVNETFTESSVNLQQWVVDDPGSHLSVGAAGLQVTGGTGSDGQTTLSLLDPVELGGALVLEAGNVSFAAGSDGQLCGLYVGGITLAGCVAGFRVRSSDGALLLAPVVDGVEAATPFTMTPNHAYTLRLRLHMPEVVRALATYYSTGAAGVLARGGGLVGSAAWVEFELQDSAAAVNTPATVLYDGTMSATPASATFAAVDSLNLQGAVGYVSVTWAGTVRVSSVPPGAAERTRRIGQAAQGAECHISGEKLYFYTAATPAAGELIKVRYRTGRRGVARLAQAGLADSSSTGVPAAQQWAGSVVSPKARCSADCEAAAQAVLDFSTSALAAWRGTLEAANLQNLADGDVWPGDTVTLTAPLVNSNGGPQPSALTVRSAVLTLVPAATEHFAYTLKLANDWSDGLSVKLSSTVAQTALLPGVAATVVNAVSPNIPLADVSAVTTTAITLTMHAAAPAGGGFEVRRQDANFGNGVNSGIPQQGLVVRSQVATFTLPRAADHEEFYVRMYDASTPPLYSRSSAAILTNVPSA